MNNAKLTQRDLKNIWHPCSQMKDYETLPLVPIKRGEGVYLEDYDGNRFIDGISSWWVNIFGHANPYINDKIKEQLDNIEHVIFAGFSHEPAIRLSERLVEMTPKGLNKVFFADNGSSAVEVAIKMSFHYFKNRGEIRDVIVSLENSYHGETLGTLAIGDVDLYKETYKEIMVQSVQAKSPALWDEDEAIADMERVFKENDGRVCSVIIEPLVQCAGSMEMYDPNYITNLRSLCDRFGIHLIADEIAVGFGRTGTMFAMEQTGVSPDFICLSKGLTGGYLPLSVVLTTDKIYMEFYCDYTEKNRTFLHSHSYTGNPLGCAAANATLDLFEQNNTIEKNRELITLIEEELEGFKSHPKIKSVRQRGMIGAMVLKEYDSKKRPNLQIFQYALTRGVLIRPLADVIYIMPPYTITKEELGKIFKVIGESLEKI